jgi:hypothetical protein
MKMAKKKASKAITQSSAAEVSNLNSHASKGTNKNKNSGDKDAASETTLTYKKCPHTLVNGLTLTYNNIPPDDPAVSLTRDNRLLRLPILDKSTCLKILELTSEFDDWNALSDSVDKKSENQHNIFDLAKGTDDGILFPFCQQLSEHILEPILYKYLGLANLRLHWAFIRKYNVDGRRDFPVHRDSSAATVNILLSDPDDFEGAELFLLPSEHKNADKLSDKQFKKSFPPDVLKQQFAVDHRQGGCCMHSGKTLHGVLPLISGFRYTLILMYLP